MVIECDVLVVGGGPAGAVAALYCAKNGLDAILIEKNDGIGKYTKTKIDASPTDGVTEIINELRLKTENLVHKSRWYSPDGNSFTLHSKIGEYYFKRGPDPDSFECITVDKALEEGCKLFLNSDIEKIEVDTKGFRSVLLKNKKTIIPKIIIAADGSNSQFHRYTNYKNSKTKIIGYGVTGKDFGYPNVSEIYLDAKLAPGEYFYILTSSTGLSTAVIGMLKDEISKSPEDCFKDFVAEHLDSNKKFEGAPVKVLGIGESFKLENCCVNNLLFVGDAGGFIDPLFSYGMTPAIVSAYYAGKYSVEAIQNDDITILKKYDKLVKRTFNEKSSYFYRRVFESLDNDDLNLVIKMFNQLDEKIDVDKFLYEKDIRSIISLLIVFVENLPRSFYLLIKISFKLLKGL